MPRTLTPDSSLETLRKEAKRWLKALRAGNAAATDRLRTILGTVPDAPILRDVQLALAREHGLPGWTALRQAIDDLALAHHSQAERAAIVLKSAWQGDPGAAKRILARWPEIGGHDLATAVVTGRIADVRRRLAADPAAATRKTGPLDWEPLLYLAFARLAGGETGGAEIATLLLDHGADPDARFPDGWGNSFTVLTGAIGEGEGDRAPHPQAEALATLLIERGADPYDPQALYNISITRDETRWLDFLWSACERRDRTAAWRETPAEIGGRVPMNVLDYLLGNAVAYDHRARAGWLIAHGANADGVHAYSGRPLHEEALVYGHGEMADLLARHGAATPPLTGQAAFQAACLRFDADTARAIAARDPDCLTDAAPMLIAAQRARADIVALLLELGMHADVADDTGLRGLHKATSAGAVDVVRLLVAHGADIDRPTKHYGGALGFAAHFGQRGIAELLAPLSRDICDLTFLAMADRVGALLAEDPALANRRDPKFGVRPLFCLPDDEDDARTMAALLLAHGADPAIRDDDGMTADMAARRRGLDDAAELMAPDRDP